MNVLLIVSIVILIILIILVISYFCFRCYNKVRIEKYNDDIKKLETNFYNSKHDRLKIPILYINLDRSKDRRKLMEKQLPLVSDNYQRVSAIDGKKISNIERGIVDGIKYFNEYAELTSSELACTMSHIKAIKTAYDKGYENVLILEDDALFYLKSLWDDSLEDIMKMAPSDWEIIKLFSGGDHCNSFKKDFKKFDINLGCPGAVSYVINKNGMEKILKYTSPFITLNKGPSNGAADWFLFSIANTYSYGIPLMLLGDHLLPSTIHKSHHNWHIGYANSIINGYKKINKNSMIKDLRELINFIKYKNIKNLVVWGLYLNHTHRYIHSSIYKTFLYIQKMYSKPLVVLWLKNDKNSKLPENSLVFSSGYPRENQDNYLHLNINNCYYITHTKDKNNIPGGLETKYNRYYSLIKNKKAVMYQELRFNKIKQHKNNIKLIKPYFYYSPINNTLIMPWATDLNPEEIKKNILNIKNIIKLRNKNIIGFVGSIWYLNKEEVYNFKEICKKYNKKFIIKNNITDNENQKFIQKCFLAPILQGKKHLGDYIPCRAFKNISYGAIPLTNNILVHKFFGSKTIHSSNLKKLLVKSINNTYPLNNQIELMNDIYKNHTYISRLNLLTKFLN